MKKPISERFVRRSIQTWLFRNGWGWNYREKETHEHGIDIQVQDNSTPNHSRRFFIEIKGASSSKSARQVSESSFVHVLGQIITRMKVVAPWSYRYGIGLPEASANIAIRRIPYKVAKVLSLYVFSVGASGKVKCYTPTELKKIQRSQKKNR